jgi:chromosome segregation ATPase
MKRLQYFNLLGVLALVLLCVAQWQHNRQLNLEVNRLEKVRLDHEAKLVEQEQTMRGLNADLAQFKEEFTKSRSELSDARQKLGTAERGALQVTIDSDQLKSSITNWAAAVAARDERLKEANAQIRRLAGELNSSARQFNALATNYNAVVKDLNDIRSHPTQPQPVSK